MCTMHATKGYWSKAMIIQAGPHEAASFTDDTSPNLQSAKKRNVSLGAKVRRDNPQRYQQRRLRSYLCNNAPSDCKLRRVKYLNNVIEQDHRAIRRAMQCFRSFHTAERTIEGIGAMHMMRKGQGEKVGWQGAVGQEKFVVSLFGVAA
jgi:transposase-like protein